ncbi:hypothetical protein KP509_20G031300 [Ceratopteris richardii]|uniref:NB-ARC domain-containing protein n=1 Tax=Ceratopteris richardii TaxID=49495 RepID=A0A8T2SE74_CERRI|nr:hypothetical protein KP509_20G031300 [Ceratopteris richardii]
MTTRYLEVLKFAQPKEIFHVEGLGNREHWERLFNWHAFLKPEPPPHLKEVSRKMIAACQGLPLSLEVMGAHLYGHNYKSYWDESLRSLQQDGKGIFSVLSLSLMGLESKQREAFLDICCFLIGEKEEIACRVLEACYGYGRTYLDVLKSRCLITIDVDCGRRENRMIMYMKGEEEWDMELYDHLLRDVGKRMMGEEEVSVIGMHDHLRDMGRDIVRRTERNRVWDKESLEDILKDEKALSRLRGISIRSDFPFSKEAGKCRSLPALKILKVKQRLSPPRANWKNIFKNNFLENVQCNELRWLDWKKARFRCLPDGLCSKNLRVLDLSQSHNQYAS